MKITKFEDSSERNSNPKKYGGMMREFHPKRGETKYFEGEMYYVCSCPSYGYETDPYVYMNIYTGPVRHTHAHAHAHTFSLSLSNTHIRGGKPDFGTTGCNNR